jgi:alpha-L-rhamnosidase
MHTILRKPVLSQMVMVFAVCLAMLATVGYSRPIDRAIDAAWIAPGPLPENSTQCPILRHEFALSSAPSTAKVRVVGLGHYELRCNGEVVGDSLINQAWSQYDKTVYSQEFDLAPYLKKGRNALAVTLGNSFWSVKPTNDPGRFIKTDAMPDFSKGQQYLFHLDGNIMTGGDIVSISTSDAWKWSMGPITFSNIYAGEDFDARLIPRGWDKPGFDDGNWKTVSVVDAPAAKVVPNPAPTMKAFEVFTPTEIKRPEAGVFTYVFPQNCSALLKFTVEGGKAGSKIRFKPSEYMDANGKVRFTYTWGTKKDIWHDYVKGTGGVESHQTIFCFVGAQFVEVQGAIPAGDPNPDNLPVITSLEQVHVRAACPIVGEFTSSSEMHNKAENLILWAVRSNMAHVPMDCPHREKNGWLEQNWHMAASMSYCFDINAWFTKTCRDMRDAQQPDGHVPTNSPNYLVGVPPHGYWNNAPEWGVSSVLVPWHLYEWYGNTKILEESFDSSKKFIDYLTSTAKDGLITSNLGDWYDYGHGQGNGPSKWTPNELSATAIWAYGTQTLAKMARVIGREAEAEQYEKQFAQIRTDFLRHFYDAEKKTFKNNGSCQAANSAALCIGLAPEADKSVVVQHIVDDLVARKYQQTPGEVLQIFLIRALAENGRGDVLHHIYNRDEVGSYGYMVKTGLTTLPESWDARQGTGDSLNHFMLGHLVEWHHAYVAGVRQAPGSVGWKKFIIAPQIPADVSSQHAITSAKVEFESPAGKIASAWELKGKKFTLHCTVPASTEVRMPDGTVHTAREGVTVLSCDIETAAK